jgi:Prokaryotic E2 family E
VTPEVRARVTRELETLNWKTKLIENPDAVIYQALPSTLGVATSDVLVLVPGGYAQFMIDGAYLPQGSPLIGVVKGQPQPQCSIAADGRTWVLISYHPHNGGGGASWDPTRHGFHTYLDELVSWLSAKR